MGDGFYFVDVVVFALIAGFLVYRLRSVLGATLPAIVMTGDTSPDQLEPSAATSV